MDLHSVPAPDITEAVNPKRVIVVFRVYSSNRLFLYDEHERLINTFHAFKQARTLIVTNQEPRFDQTLSGKVLFDDTIPVQGTPEYCIVCHLNGQKLYDMYSLSRFVYQPTTEAATLTFIE